VKRALALIMLLWCSRASAQAEPCGALEFAQEVLIGDSTTSVCPKPDDQTLDALSLELERTFKQDTRGILAVLKGLRDHLRAAKQPQSWRAALAERLDALLQRNPKAPRPVASFAAVRGPASGLDPDACLFVTSDAGQPDYACYVLAGTVKPRGPQVYELSDFGDAYIAHRALGLAYFALVKLDVVPLEAAIARLEQASQRWHRLRTRGYLQYPWELLLSSALSSYQDYQACFASDEHCTGEEGLDPERWRVIALHPGIGMGFSGFGKHPDPSLDASLALSIELFGLTRYNESFSSYFGASLGALVNDGDFRDLRPGLFVHLTRWLHLGYGLSVMREASRFDGTIFFSTDLGTALGLDFLDP
jgi:hypothetical protein